MLESDLESLDLDTRIAVVGMSARFPGAPGLAGYWRNLAGAVDCVSRFPAPDGAAHVPARALLDGPDCFDADFFGYAPRDALIIDPQHRVFMECSWEALEHAGYDPGRHTGAIGVYAGCAQTGNAEHLHRRRDSRLLADISEYEVRLGSGPDFLTSRTAFKLGLRGPAVTVQTACSTSLVAVHTAVQALLAGECDMALAGGATVHVPRYLGDHTAEGIMSPTGYCRPFDAAADGTVGGDGAGVVVLKRLRDALRDADSIYAVVLGSAINNDGADKIGYTAPSVTGQAKAVSAALHVAGVSSDSVTYVETHGTGTPLGDPVEIAALAEAFRATADPDPAGPPPVCRIGSVKSNIGHTDAAAGVAGLIKTVLALHHRTLPPSLHYDRPNPQIDFASTRFEVVTRTTPWTAPGPLRAGVTSLGIGGTNAHVVLEEAPAATRLRQTRTWRLVTVSARSKRALRTTVAAAADQARTEPSADLGSIAWTLQTGRRRHAHRAFAVVDGADGLTTDSWESLAPPSEDRRTTVFLFPGQGSQHVGMTRDLYRREPVLRRQVDDCARLFLPWLGADLRDTLYAAPDDDGAAARMSSMTLAQACVFTVEYALARLWERWGVRPDAVTGHSLGAYAAAGVAGVFDLPDAVRLVAARGRVLQDLPDGAMIAVAASEDEVRAALGPGLSVAAVNSRDQCVVSGAADAVKRIAAEFEERGVEVRTLRISAGAHSALIDPYLDSFTDTVAGLQLSAPSVSILSDHTGTWLTPDQARDPGYWAAHLRQTVRFADVLQEVASGSVPRTLIEVGPGATLTSLARRHPGHDATAPSPTSLPPAGEGEDESAHLLRAAGRLWLAGHELDWDGLNDGERHRRVPLPTYPFERLRFDVGAGPGTPVTIEPAVPARAEFAEFAEFEEDDEDDEDDRYVEPRDALEAAVAEAFGHVLGVERVGAYDSFLTLGGDSLTASRLTAWIRGEYRVPFAVRDVFATPTVESLARTIASLGAEL